MIYSDEVTLTSGTVAGAFGTAGTVTLNSQARRILAILNSGCDTVYTTAEGSAVILRLNSSSLGISDQRYEVGPYITSGPATNSSGQEMVPEIIPVDIPCSGNEVISLDTALTVTNTTGKSNMVSLLYTDGLPGLNGAAPVLGSYAPPTDWLSRFPNVVPNRGGYVSTASQLTTNRTALTAINIPSWATEIIAVKATDLKTGAITAGQSAQFVAELVSTIPNVSPLKIPSNSLGPTLGTPVGTGMFLQLAPWIPVHIKCTGKNETITPYVNLVAAVSTGNNVSVAAMWR